MLIPAWLSSKARRRPGSVLPAAGGIFLSVKDADKPAIVPLAGKLHALGFVLYCTEGTSTVLRNHGIPARAVFRISTGRPNVLDLIAEKQIAWIVNTPGAGEAPRLDEVRMRTEAVTRGIPVTTTARGLAFAVDGLEALRATGGHMAVCSLQEFHRHAPRLKDLQLK